MCCDGTIFHYVRLQAGDSAKALVALGLKLKRKRKRDHLLQPCPAHRDCQCSIYNDRPERCRLFECKQLQKVSAGEITEGEASGKIREARERVGRILTLFELAGETNSKGPLAIRYEKILAMPLDPAAGEEAALRARLIREMEEFEALVENEFRPARTTQDQRCGDTEADRGHPRLGCGASLPIALTKQELRNERA
jgi:Fe-S-cluster containining protein